MLRGLGIVLASLLALAASPALSADSSLSLQANQAFLAKNKTQPGVITRPSGLQYRIIQNGFGKHPRPTDQVSVAYTGKLINGTVFDGTELGMPATFVTNRLIPGWTEALQIMREGDHWELFIPSQLAYGTRGAGDGLIPPNQTLVFDLILLKVLGPSKEQEEQDQAQQKAQQDQHPGPGAE
jgi:FKBP-type peptidyl-prolyl cis-trans isomerase